MDPFPPNHQFVSKLSVTPTLPFEFIFSQDIVISKSRDTFGVNFLACGAYIILMWTALTLKRSTFRSHDEFMYFAWFLKNGNYFIGTFNAHRIRTKGRAWRPFNKREIAENDMSNRRAKIMLKRM